MKDNKSKKVELTIALRQTGGGNGSSQRQDFVNLYVKAYDAQGRVLS